MTSNRTAVLIRTSTQIATGAANGRTIELRMDDQSMAAPEWREYYIICDGEWDARVIRGRDRARAEYDSILSFWQEDEAWEAEAAHE